MFGFININKPHSMTSFDVVAVLRRITHIKQIGHTGTLDPFATGVLPICIGKATKLIEYLPDDKEYIATVQFGANTDTYDLEGDITQTFDKKITQNDVENILKDFEGEIEQFPPIYSAIKVKGKKLYEYAREGKEVEIKPRKVCIKKIELVSFDNDKQTAQILVECSKGTYIRSIAYDIGQKLNCGGHLIALKRTKAGLFNIEKSLNLEDIKSIQDIEKNLINPLDVVPIGQYQLNDIEKEKISHGMSINNPHPTPLPLQRARDRKEIVFLVCGDKIHAIGMVTEDKIVVKKVFEVL
ncbi:tRNA pseudouridine(55) synthase TruB [bacterium]|nr:tRNA pseudouridine(55) synthase TruB [bacterium]